MYARFLFGVVLVGLLVAAPAVLLRTLGLFAGCSAAGTSQDLFVAYCNNDAGFSYFEHGAYYFALPTAVSDRIRAANVVFLGSSRMQHVFSSLATKQFFRERNVAHYLLGFSYGEQDAFEGELLDRLTVKPKVLVVNADPFFSGAISPVATWVMQHGRAREEMYVKAFAQWLDRAFCSEGGYLSSAADCSEHPRGVKSSGAVIFRSRHDGSWDLSRWCQSCRERVLPFEEADVDSITLLRLRQRAEAFVRRSGVPAACVILTVVPSPEFKGSASALAAAIGARVVQPRLDAADITTLDGSHLSPVSAEKWSAEFLREAWPYMAQCLDSGSKSDSSIPTAGAS